MNWDIFDDHDLGTEAGVDGFAGELLEVIDGFLEELVSSGNSDHELSPKEWFQVQEAMIRRLKAQAVQATVLEGGRK